VTVASGSPAISVAGLVRTFGPVRAVDDLTFEVARGEVVGLLGHNGAGKTTTIRVLNGLLRPDAGSVRVLGLDPTTAGPDIRARSGVLTETPSLDERLTAAENLRFFGELFGVEPAVLPGRVAELLDRFELTDRSGDRVAGFSRGMKQRLALARALIHDPELLFFDEPTAALDPVAARGVHDLIRGLAGDPRRTVLISTHNLVEAQRLCDRVLILRQGRLIASGSPRELARALAGQRRVELEVDGAEAGRVAAAVAEVEPDASVSKDGEVVAIGGIGREDIPALLRHLLAAGVAVYRVSPAEPSLEDAYLALYGAGTDQSAGEGQIASEGPIASEEQAAAEVEEHAAAEGEDRPAAEGQPT
jgi:ABC-2 type transport system ATP-binding protein